MVTLFPRLNGAGLSSPEIHSFSSIRMLLAALASRFQVLPQALFDPPSLFRQCKTLCTLLLCTSFLIPGRTTTDAAFMFVRRLRQPWQMHEDRNSSTFLKRTLGRRLRSQRISEIGLEQRRLMPSPLFDQSPKPTITRRSRGAMKSQTGLGRSRLHPHRARVLGEMHLVRGGVARTMRSKSEDVWDACAPKAFPGLCPGNVSAVQEVNALYNHTPHHLIFTHTAAALMPWRYVLAYKKCDRQPVETFFFRVLFLLVCKR